MSDPLSIADTTSVTRSVTRTQGPRALAGQERDDQVDAPSTETTASHRKRVAAASDASCAAGVPARATASGARLTTGPIRWRCSSSRAALGCPTLVPVRYGRMLESPSTFFRGAPLVMASDLSRTPSNGIHIQICGDAHLLNFGTYATPERNMIFDVNDFDETHIAPWEWDVKRLAASIVVAARTSGLDDQAGVAAVQQAAAEYRSALSSLAGVSPFEAWHSRIDVDAVGRGGADETRSGRAPESRREGPAAHQSSSPFEVDDRRQKGSGSSSRIRRW